MKENQNIENQEENCINKIIQLDIKLIPKKEKNKEVDFFLWAVNKIMTMIHIQQIKIVILKPLIKKYQ